MSCKSAIFTANTNAQTVAVGGMLALGSTIRRYGCNLNQNGNSITINGCDDAGYYDVKPDRAHRRRDRYRLSVPQQRSRPWGGCFRRCVYCREPCQPVYRGPGAGVLLRR